MLPPDLAAFTFAFDEGGSDSALARRTLADAPPGPLVVAACRRRGLVAALAASRRVTVVEPARQSLTEMRAGLELTGGAGNVEMYAADLRDLDVPGGAAAVLLPAAAWRVLAHRTSRASMLGSVRRALRPGGRLLVDADRAPAAPRGPAPLRTGPGRQSWTLGPGPADGTVRVTCESPGTAARSLDLAADTPESFAAEIAAAGFVLLRAEDANGRPAAPSSPRTWIVAAARGKERA